MINMIEVNHAHNRSCDVSTIALMHDYLEAVAYLKAVNELGEPADPASGFAAGCEGV